MAYSYKAKIEGKEISLDLSDMEVQSAVSIIEGNNVKELHILKKSKKDGALFFIEERLAVACQERHKFEFLFSLESKDLTE